VVGLEIQSYGCHHLHPQTTFRGAIMAKSKDSKKETKKKPTKTLKEKRDAKKEKKKS
jgi:hypothetical protein